MGKAQGKKSGNRVPESAPQGAGDVFGTILETVSGGIAKSVQGTGKAGALFQEAVTDVVQSALRQVAEGGDSGVMGAKAIVVGVLRSIGEKEEPALTTLSHTARSVIRQAAALGTDVAACTKGVILGAIASAKDLGVDRGKAASAAAQGALDGGHEAGPVAAEKVREALKESIGGVTVGIPEPLRK